MDDYMDRVFVAQCRALVELLHRRGWIESGGSRPLHELVVQLHAAAEGLGAWSTVQRASEPLHAVAPSACTIGLRRCHPGAAYLLALYAFSRCADAEQRLRAPAQALAWLAEFRGERPCDEDHYAQHLEARAEHWMRHPSDWPPGAFTPPAAPEPLVLPRLQAQHEPQPERFNIPAELALVAALSAMREGPRRRGRVIDGVELIDDPAQDDEPPAHDGPPLDDSPAG